MEDEVLAVVEWEVVALMVILVVVIAEEEGEDEVNGAVEAIVETAKVDDMVAGEVAAKEEMVEEDAREVRVELPMVVLPPCEDVVVFADVLPEKLVKEVGVADVARVVVDDDVRVVVGARMVAVVESVFVLEEA